MSFDVILTKLAKIWPHPNADKLELAQIENSAYQFVVGKGQYKVGDQVVYFPIDSLLPTWIIEKVGLVGKLAGPLKNRIKTIKLRGEISQGLVVSSSMFHPSIYSTNLTKFFGVTKYEPPPIICNTGNLVKMPDGVSVYDIEGADANPSIVEKLLNRHVYITEKLEGTNFWVSCLGDNVSVGQRQYAIEPIAGSVHTFWQAAMDCRLIDLCQRLAAKEFSGKRVTLRGELCGPGIQKNIYGLKQVKVFLFDILVDYKYLGADDFIDYAYEYETVPVLSRGITLKEWLDNRSLRAASDGVSKLNDVAREGIVVKPMLEEEIYGFGRLMIKQRSPEYLAQSDF